MRSLELHVGPHGLKVVVGEDDDRPPAVVDTLEDLVWDGGAGSPVPAVNETFVALGFGLLRPLQPAEENPTKRNTKRKSRIDNAQKSV